MGIREFGNSLPVVGGVFEGLFGSPEQEKRDANLKRIMADIKMRQGMMPEMSQNMLNRQFGAMSPSNNLIGEMYGPQYMQDPSKFQQSPIPQGMFGPPPAAPVNGNGISVGSADPNTVDPWTGWGGRPAQPRGR